MNKTFHETQVKNTDTNNGTLDVTVTTRLNITLTENDILNWIANCNNPATLTKITSRANLRSIHLNENHGDLHDRE